MIATFATNVWSMFSRWRAHRQYKRACYGLKVSSEVISKWSLDE